MANMSRHNQSAFIRQSAKAEECITLDRVFDFEALSKLKDTTIVELPLGKAERIGAVGVIFDVRTIALPETVKFQTTQLSAGILETDLPVRFFVDRDFRQLASLLGEKEVKQLAKIGAWFDLKEGAIEVPCVAGAGGRPPATFKMTGLQLKQLACKLQHEAAHAAGAREFLAYYEEALAAQTLGLCEGPPNIPEIMEHIRKAGYDGGEYAAALEELEQFSRDDFYRYINERGDADLREMESDLLNPGFASGLPDDLDFPDREDW